VTTDAGRAGFVNMTVEAPAHLTGTIIPVGPKGKKSGIAPTGTSSIETGSSRNDPGSKMRLAGGDQTPAVIISRVAPAGLEVSRRIFDDWPAGRQESRFGCRSQMGVAPDWYQRHPVCFDWLDSELPE